MVAEKFGPRQPNHRREPVGSEATHGRRLDPPVEHPVLPLVSRKVLTSITHIMPRGRCCCGVVYDIRLRHAYLSGHHDAGLLRRRRVVLTQRTIHQAPE